MISPRVEIDLDKIRHNARTLVDRLSGCGISVTAVTKATLGSYEVANALLQSGVCGLGDSRIENIEAMRAAEIRNSMTLIRSPMLSQASEVVASADVSFNTEIDVIRQLSACASKAGCTHGVVLMIELGDLREGIMPENLEHVVSQTLALPNIRFQGIGTNLACRNGVSPDGENMAELSGYADSIEAKFGLEVETVSGGNSANLTWALSGAETGRVNDLRLGESILLGCEPLHRVPIDGLHTDAITLFAEVIESKVKPSKPWGNIAQTAFGAMAQDADRGCISQTILAIGREDTDPCGLQAPAGIVILGASSDHLIVDSGADLLPIGTELQFQLNYSALIRVMTSPFVTKDLKQSSHSDLMPRRQIES